MGSKERVARLKADTRKHILDAAMAIVRREGWRELSLRKIADTIEYTPPVIYCYFLNKEAVLIELARRTYALLIARVEQRLADVTGPKQRLETILRAYLAFAIEEKELYQLLYAVGTDLEDVKKTFPGLAVFMDLFRKELAQLVSRETFTETYFHCKYFTMVAFIHGLVSVNSYFKDIEPAVNDQLLNDAIAGMLRSAEWSYKTIDTN
ncbi:transcriptional regulator, TetR family [Mucilaginibacter pineti]|uniref:Transcriptional regulator, TetR family n=1 Tax=Mucilaginibacter pineti TaxID=1391627 RepID=A0A1G7NWT0_9SPHI|nr:TetR/AcrR family transcriptional regulator [Mucilaginibacter pineti]SDF77809.1 transcriptional regulator, TetR family [Mucilaginibacter pineti]